MSTYYGVEQSTDSRCPMTKVSRLGSGKNGPMVHCLRHAWNNAVRQVTPEHVRQSILGHADEASGRAYTAAERREQKRAVGAAMRLVKGGGR